MSEKYPDWRIAKMRRKYGDTNPVVAAVDADTVIKIGDLVWQDADDAKPASVITDGPRAEFFGGKISLRVPAQENFAAKFLGVAMQRSRDGDTVPVCVAATGVFRFDCPSGTFELGDLVGVYALQGSGGSNSKYLQNQIVEKVGKSRCAIGRVVKREASPATSVLVDIRSTVMTGGVVSHT